MIDINKFSDSPECACPVISAFLREWNDDLPDNERTSVLSDLIPMIIGTKAGYRVEQQRANMIADWLIRSYTPTWLNLAGLNDQANTLCSLPEITSVEQLSELRPMLVSIRKDAESAFKASANTPQADELDVVLNAARGIALDAARAVAWNTISCTAMNAALAVAFNATSYYARDVVFAAAFEAALVVALGAAFAAAQVVAFVAAKDFFAFAREDAFEAASNALAQTKGEVQRSAKELVIRMCEIK